MILEDFLKYEFYFKRRGPDSFGVWVEEKKKLTLSHRRLSIIDLNERSNQPMQSRNKDLLLFLMVKYIIT